MYANSNYSFNPWMQDLPILGKPPVYRDEQDRLRFEALVSQMALTSDEIRTIRPTVGNTPFPPRLGYEKRQPTITDVLTVGFPTLQRDTLTRQETGQPGTLRNSLPAW